MTETPPVRFCIDWWAGSIWASADVVLRLVAVHFLGADPFDDEYEKYFEPRNHGARFYRVLRGAEGISVYSDPLDGRGHVHVEMKGQALQGVPLETMQAFWQEIDRVAMKWSSARVDLTWDFVPFSPMQVHGWARSRDFKSVVNRDQHGWLRLYISEPGEDPDDDESDVCGTTCYFGRRGSARMFRCYDGRGHNRMEFVQKDDWATYTVKNLMTMPTEGWSMMSLGYLRRFVDFVDRVEGENVTRASRDASRLKAEWREFIGGAITATGKVKERRLPSVVKEVKAVSKKAMAKLAAAIDVLGPKWFGGEVAKARAERSVQTESYMQRLRAACVGASDVSPSLSIRESVCEVARRGFGLLFDPPDLVRIARLRVT